MNSSTSDSEARDYLRCAASTLVLALVSVSGLNYYVDPSKIYHDTNLYAKTFATRLIQSPHALYVPQNLFEERTLAKELAQNAEPVDCVVIGSSHVLPISNLRPRRSLGGICGTILNLGVSGAGIEDHMAMAYLSSTARGRPNSIVLGVAPWTFSYDKDTRWSAYGNEYREARESILGDKGARLSFRQEWEKAKNLVNLEYAQASLGTLYRYGTEPPEILSGEGVDPEVGGLGPARLPDASYIYPRKYIDEAKTKTVRAGGEVYKTDGKLNNADAVRDYRKLLLWLRTQGVEPVLLLTPYHGNVWKASSSPNVIAMKETQKVIDGLAAELHIRVIGSYEPWKVGCQDDEFYDFMHPTASCLAKLH